MSQSVKTNLENRKLKKHVAAIHTDGQLSLLQRKLSNVLLVNAYDALLTKQEHEIDEKTLCVMLGYNSNDRVSLKNALKALISIQAEWDILGDDGGEVEWGAASLLSHAVLTKGRCRYGYAPALAEKLYNPAIYASINMKVQRRFKSGHALALYENCYRFKNVGSTGWWSIQTFRRLLGVGESDYYKAFKHLNAKIIKPVVKEINAHSDIEIVPEFRRKGRAVSEIRFTIKPNEQLPLMDIGDDDSLKGTAIYERLRKLGISHKLATQWIISHGESYVREKLDYADNQNKSGKIKGNVSGFLNAAIKDDYKSPNVVPMRRPSASRVSAKEEEKLAKEKLEREKNIARRRAEKFAFEKAKQEFDVLDESRKLELLKTFEVSLEKGHIKADYKKYGLSAPLVSVYFTEFMNQS